MSLSDWLLLISLFGSMGVTILKVRRLMTMNATDFSNLYIEFFVACLLWVISLAAMVSNPGILSGTIFKIVTFMVTLTGFLFAMEHMLLLKETFAKKS